MAPERNGFFWGGEEVPCGVRAEALGQKMEGKCYTYTHSHTCTHTHVHTHSVNLELLGGCLVVLFGEQLEHDLWFRVSGFGFRVSGLAA